MPAALLLALWLLAPAPRGAAADPLVALHAEALQAGLPPAVIGRLLGAGYRSEAGRAALPELLPELTAALEDALPLDPLVGKIEEGLAKRVPPAAMLAALQRLRGDLAYSRERLAPFGGAEAIDDKGAEALTILAGTLGLGLERQTIDRFCRDLPPGSPPIMVAVALESKALLGQIDFRAELLDPLLREGLARNALGMEWRKLAGIVALARRRGMADETLAAEAAAILAAGGNLRDLLTRLGFTSRNLAQPPLQERAAGFREP